MSVGASINSLMTVFANFGVRLNAGFLTKRAGLKEKLFRLPGKY
jgi:hypothetical protein